MARAANAQTRFWLPVLAVTAVLFWILHRCCCRSSPA